MSQTAVAIPEKLFFKIGEVCELAGVQAHVLRYWESEFPMLAPQKNRAGQRVYRKRDVEMALRIKELLYEDQYTIAGARKRLTNEQRAGGKLKVVAPETGTEDSSQVTPPPETLVATGARSPKGSGTTKGSAGAGHRTAEERAALKRIASELHELLRLVESGTNHSRSRK